MLGINRLLVVIERSSDAPLVMETAIQLANAADAAIDVVHVIYEGFVDLSVHEVEASQELKIFAMQAAESYLEELVDPFRTRVRSLTSSTIWHKDSWQGVLSAAHACDADLILKASSATDDPGSISRTPQDWNLLRHATVPVMLIKPDAWVPNPIIFAAVDAVNADQHDLNIKILKEAASLATILGGELDIVTAVPLSEPWSEPVPGLDTSAVRKQVEEVVRMRITDLNDEAGISYRDLHVEDGKAAMAIRSRADQSGAEILVMGTVARSGVTGVVLGNTSEMIVHHCHSDVVVLRQ